MACHQVITWSNADLLSNGPFGTNFSEILIEIQTFSGISRKCIWKCRLQFPRKVDERDLNQVTYLEI